MKRKAILKEVTLNNNSFKTVVQQSSDLRKEIHKDIVQGAKDAGIVEALTSSKKIPFLPSAIISNGRTTKKRVLKKNN